MEKCSAEEITELLDVPGSSTTSLLLSGDFFASLSISAAGSSSASESSVSPSMKSAFLLLLLLILLLDPWEPGG